MRTKERAYWVHTPNNQNKAFAEERSQVVYKDLGGSHNEVDQEIGEVGELHTCFDNFRGVTGRPIVGFVDMSGDRDGHGLEIGVHDRS